MLMEVPSTAIVSANKEVRHVVSKEPAKQRGPHVKFTAEQRAVIGKRAAEYGIVAAIWLSATTQSCIPISRKPAYVGCG